MGQVVEINAEFSRVVRTYSDFLHNSGYLKDINGRVLGQCHMALKSLGRFERHVDTTESVRPLFEEAIASNDLYMAFQIAYDHGQPDLAEEIAPSAIIQMLEKGRDLNASKIAFRIQHEQRDEIARYGLRHSVDISDHLTGYYIAEQYLPDFEEGMAANAIMDMIRHCNQFGDFIRNNKNNKSEIELAEYAAERRFNSAVNLYNTYFSQYYSDGSSLEQRIANFKSVFADLMEFQTKTIIRVVNELPKQILIGARIITHDESTRIVDHSR